MKYLIILMFIITCGCHFRLSETYFDKEHFFPSKSQNQEEEEVLHFSPEPDQVHVDVEVVEERNSRWW